MSRTVQRHKGMTCKVYELKIDRSHLKQSTLDSLNRLFLEAKWFYNYLLSNGDILHGDYKTKAVMVKNKEGELERRELVVLSSQMRQGILARTKRSLKSIAAKRDLGYKVGSLRFKSRVKSIPLCQFGGTHRIQGATVAVQNVKQQMRVNGLDQIPERVEIANATLEHRSGDYFIHLTTYQEPVGSVPPNQAIGIDVGIKHQLVFSNGLQIDEGVHLDRRVARLHRKLSRRRYRGKNWSKTKAELEREYTRLVNRRVDIRHKIVSKLVSTYAIIAIQEENVRAWGMLWGRQILASAVGGIISDLKAKSRTLVVVSRFEPTTQKCSRCSAMNETDLGERSYECHACGLLINRDLNSAINMWNAVPVERRESTPADTKTATKLMEYFNSIPGVSACLVKEAGSQLPVTGLTVNDRR